MPTAKWYSGMIKSTQWFFCFTVCSHIHVCICDSVSCLISDERVLNHTHEKIESLYSFLNKNKIVFLKKKTYSIGHKHKIATLTQSHRKKNFSLRKNWQSFTRAAICWCIWRVLCTARRFKFDWRSSCWCTKDPIMKYQQTKFTNTLKPFDLQK